MIRRATVQDAQGICDVVNPIIRDTIITFTTLQKTPQDIASAITSGTPFWVTYQGDAITGYASYAPFRAGPGYRHTMEHSIVLTDAARGQGLGRALVEAVAEHARDAGAHSLIAGVSGPNTAALAFHAALGFVQVGHIPEAGFKFDQWIDLVLLQKRLLPQGSTG